MNGTEPAADPDLMETRPAVADETADVTQAAGSADPGVELDSAGNSGNSVESGGPRESDESDEGEGVPAPASVLTAATGAAPEPVPDLSGSLEALLVVAEEALRPPELVGPLGHAESDIVATLEQLAADYEQAGRGLRLRRGADGWRLASAAEHDETIRRVLLSGRTGRLSNAALETLAVIAYRQPVTRGRVAAIRGVGVDGVMRTLLSRGLVEESGSEAGALLYRTTSVFLDRLGLDSLSDLPPIAPLLPEMGELDEFSS